MEYRKHELQAYRNDIGGQEIYIPALAITLSFDNEVPEDEAIAFACGVIDASLAFKRNEIGLRPAA